LFTAVSLEFVTIVMRRVTGGVVRARPVIRRDCERFGDRVRGIPRIAVVGHQPLAPHRIPPQEYIRERAQRPRERGRHAPRHARDAQERRDRDRMVDVVVLRKPGREQAAEREAGDDDGRAETARDRERFLRGVDEMLRAQIAQLVRETVVRAVARQPRDEHRVAARVQAPRQPVALHRARGETVEEEHGSRRRAAVREQHRAAARVDRAVVARRERGVASEGLVVARASAVRIRPHARTGGRGGTAPHSPPSRCGARRPVLWR
jgi:hypothetical protein